MKPHFTIVITSRNDPSAQIERCLRAALSQAYPSFRVMWFDDASESGGRLESALRMAGSTLTRESGLFQGFAHYTGPGKDLWIGGSVERRYAMERFWTMTKLAVELEPNTVILQHGGDDCLAGPHVLTRIAKEYESGAWFTYGQYRQFPSNIKGRCVPFEPGVLENRMARSRPFISMHPTTFYGKLLLKVREQDLKINGRWLDTCADTAMHFPMLEMCGSKERVRFIDEVLYFYTEQDPKRFYSEEYALQCFMNWHSRHLGRYSTLASLDDTPTVETEDSSDWGLVFQGRRRIYEAKFHVQEVTDAVPEPSPAAEIPRDGGEGRDLQGDGGGVRQGEQGDEAPRPQEEAGQEKEEASSVKDLTDIY